MAAYPVAPHVTADEFLLLYAGDDDSRYELIDGEVYSRPVPGSPHDAVKNNLKELFDRAGLDRNVFRCWIEHTFRMSDSRVMTPDVAILRTERGLRHVGPTLGAPEIAIEVAMSDKPALLQRKISAYLNNGAHAVCCVYPDLRNVVVYTAYEWRELTERSNLEFPLLLPGVSIAIAEIFDGV